MNKITLNQKGILQLLMLGLCFLMYTDSAYAQSNTEDRAERLVAKAENCQNPNDVLRILKKLSPSDIPNDSLIARYYYLRGISHGQLGDEDFTLHNMGLCRTYALKEDQFTLVAWTYNAEGVMYRTLDKQEESLESFQNALRVLEKVQDSNIAKAEILGNMAGVFFQIKDFDSSLKYTEEALNVSLDVRDTAMLGWNNLRLAMIYRAIDSIDASLNYGQVASDYLVLYEDSVGLLYSAELLGYSFERKGNLTAALENYQHGVDLAKGLGHIEYIAQTQVSMAEIKLSQRKIKEAEQYINEVLIYAKKTEQATILKESYEILSEIELAKGNYEKALKYSNQFHLMVDSINSVEVKERVAELQTKYETAQKEAEIKELSLANEVKEATLARNRVTLIATIIVAILCIVFLATYFIYRNKKERLEREAQELQLEALKNRFVELNSSPSELAVALDFDILNAKLEAPLSEREFDCLRLSLEGKINAQIGEKLHISVSTVKYHLRNTYAKLGVVNRKEAFRFMLQVVDS